MDKRVRTLSKSGGYVSLTIHLQPGIGVRQIEGTDDYEVYIEDQNPASQLTATPAEHKVET